MSEVTYLEALRRGLAEAMAADERVVALSSDLAADPVFTSVPADRAVEGALDGPGLAAVAVGAALAGLRPVVGLPPAAAELALAALGRLVAIHRGAAPLPLVARVPGAGVLAALDATVGWSVVVPARPAEARSLLPQAVAAGRPVVFVEERGLDAVVGPLEDAGAELGRARLARPGRDLAVVTWGAMLAASLAAADRLAAEGIEIEVLDLTTLEPLDEAALLATVRNTSRVVVAGAGPRAASPAAAVAARIADSAFEWLDAPVERLCCSAAAPGDEEDTVETLVALGRRLARY